MDAEGTMSLRRGPGRPRRQGSGSPAERRRRTYVTSEDSPASSPATNSPAADVDMSPVDSPGPSTRSSQRKISSESKISIESRRDSSESRVSNVSEVDLKYSHEGDEMEPALRASSSRRKEKPDLPEEELEEDEEALTEYEKKTTPYDPSCALCCCGEKSLLGQGDLLKFDPTPGFNPFKRQHPKAKKTFTEDTLYNPHKRTSLTFTIRRSRNQGKQRERSRSPRRVTNAEYTASPMEVAPINQSAEVYHVGHKEEPEIMMVIDPTGHSTAHHCCAAWSDNVCQNENFQLLHVDKAIFSGISQRCSYCFRFGATISCAEPGCSRIYHYPCAASSGSFQGIKSLVLLCPEHLESTEDRVEEEELECVICDEPGNLAESLFCTSCGQHYHATCLDPPVATTPIVRAGWQCPNCKICQTCRQPGDDNKMLVCDICDKGYHTFCLSPAMTTIPKNGWKCTNCRRCADCGGDSAGNNPSARWHHNYTVCDACYLQRNKTSMCPICRKTLRHLSAKSTVVCSSCQRHIHADCEDEDLVSNYHQLKTAGHSATYQCPECRSRQYSGPEMETQTVDTDGSADTKSPAYSRSPRSLTPVQDDSLQSSQDFPFSASSLCEDSISSADTDTYSLEEKVEKKEDPLPSPSFQTFSTRRHAGGGKPLDKMSLLVKFSSKKHSKRRERERNRERDRSYLGLAKRKSRNSSGRRGPRPKIKNLLPPDGSSQEAHDGVIEKMPEKLKDDEDDSPMHTTIVLFPTSDTFTFNQDMCVACGSFGQGAEGRLITCSQCGQCYHPYCVSIKITKVVLSKGWRCLDCTVCEGCGKNTDEARLLLCDDCDISYHTYCLDPPLHVVPKGGWKCKWCILYVSCLKCGATTPGINSEWTSNYTKCGPCGSLHTCPICRRDYHGEDLICQCTHCERWLHGACDGMYTEEEVEKASSEKSYMCGQCRPFFREPTPPPPPPPPEPEKPPSPVIVKIPVKEPVPSQHHSAPFPPSEPVKPKIHELEGVGLTESGFKQITSLALPPMPKKKKMPKSMKSGSLEILKTLADPNSDLSNSTKDMPMDLGSNLPMAPDKLQDLSFIPEVTKEKKKRRCGPKPGIGGFIARQRKPSSKPRSTSTDSEDLRMTEAAMSGEAADVAEASKHSGKHDKQKRKRRTKNVSELEQKFPSYIQEAFFGKSLLDQSKEKTDGTSLSGEDVNPSLQTSINISDKMKSSDSKTGGLGDPKQQTPGQDSDLGGGDDPLNFIPHAEIINMLIGDNLEKTDPTSLTMPSVEGDEQTSQPQPQGNTDASAQSNNPDQIEELESILNSNLVQMVPEDDLVHMDGKEVEDLLSGVLSPNEQNQQHLSGASNNLPPSSAAAAAPPPHHPVLPGRPHPPKLPSLPNIIPSTKSTSQGSDVTSPAFSPDYSEPPSPWPGIAEGGSSQDSSTSQSTKSDISSQKWEKDEQLGQLATISAVYYCNINHPRLTEEFPDWSSRLKQIRKMWRNVTPGDRQFYLQKARENRAALRIKEAQKISEDIQRKRLAEQDGGMSSGQRGNPQHSVVANQTAMEGQPHTPHTPGMQNPLGMQGDMVNQGQRIPQAPDRIPPSPMVQTPTGALPGSGFPMTPGAPSPAQQSIHSGSSTPVHLPERSPHHVVDTVLPGPHSGIPHGMNGIPLGPTTPTMPAVVENPMQSPTMAPNPMVPQMGNIQPPHMAGGNSGTVTPSPVQSPFGQAPPPPPTFSSGQENIQGMDSFQGTDRNVHLQQLREWLAVRNGRRREQQGWSNEQPRPPPPPYPGNNPGQQQMGQFPPGMHPSVVGNFVDPTMAGQNSFPVQRPQYVVSGMNHPRMMSDISGQMQVGGQGMPPNHMPKPMFNAVDARTGATIVRPPGAQGQFIELRHNMANPVVHQRPRHLGLSLLNKKGIHRPGVQGNPTSGDLYDQFLQHETGSIPGNQPGMYRQVSVPSHVANAANMVTQRRLSLPDNQVSQMLGIGRPPIDNAAASGGVLPPPPPPPVNQPSSRPPGPPSSSAANHPVGPNPDHEAQLDDLLKEGDFNLLDYAVSDVDTNKNSEENQSLFKAFGLGDDHEEAHEASSSSASDQKRKEEAAHRQLLKDLEMEAAKSQMTVTSQQGGHDKASKQGQATSAGTSKGAPRGDAKEASKSKEDKTSELSTRDGPRKPIEEEGKDNSDQNTDKSSTKKRRDLSGNETNDKPVPQGSVTTEAVSKTDGGTGEGKLNIKKDGVKGTSERPLTKEAKQEAAAPKEMKIKLEPEEQSSSSSCKHQGASPEVLASEPAAAAAGAAREENAASPGGSKSAEEDGNIPPKTAKSAFSEGSEVTEAVVKSEEESGRERLTTSDGNTSSTDNQGNEKNSKVEETVSGSSTLAKTDVKDKAGDTNVKETGEGNGDNQIQAAVGESLPNVSAPVSVSKQIRESDKQESESKEGSIPRTATVGDDGPSGGDGKATQQPQGTPSQEEQGGVRATSSEISTGVTPVSSSTLTSSAPLSGGASASSSAASRQNRPLLLEEQPLLLQDLLAKEKKEQAGQSGKVPPMAEGVIAPPSSSGDSLPFPELNDMDLKQLQEEAKLIAKDNPTMQSPPGNLTTAYYPNQEAEKVKKPPGPHARLLQAMNQQHQLKQQQNNPQNFGLHLGGEVVPGSFPNQEGMEPNPIPGPRGFPQGPRLPGPQHFPIPPQSPLPQGQMVPGMQQMHNPQQNSMVQVGVMPGGGNQVGNVMQMQQNAMQQRGMRPVMGNRMPGPPRMPNGVPRVRPPMISPNNHMQNPNFSIPEGFQRMPGMSGIPPHMAGYPYSHMGDPSQFQRFDPYDGSEEPAPDKENVEEYQNWLKRREQVVHRRVKFFEAEVGKERKKKKALAAKKRSCEKNKKTMDAKDVKELEAVTQRHSQFQKHLDNARKQFRQHSILAQEFKMKQQQANPASTFPHGMSMRAPSMLVQGLPGRRGVAQQMIGHHPMMQLGPGNFPVNQQDMDFNPQGMIPMDPRGRIHMNGQQIMMNNQMAMRHPGPHQMPRMSTPPQPNMVQPGHVSPMMVPNQPMLPPQHSPLVHASQGNVVLQSQQSPMIPLQSHMVPSPSPMMSPQSPMVPPQSPLGPPGIPGSMQSPLLAQSNSQRVQSPMLPHAPSPLSHLGGIVSHGHRSPMTLPQGQQSPLPQRSPVMMQPGYQSPHHQMLMNHKQAAEGQKVTPFRVPAGQQSPMKSRTVVLPGHRSPMFQSVSSPVGQLSPMVALSPSSSVVSQSTAAPKSSNNVVMADQQSPLFSHSPSPMGVSHQSPQNPGQKSPMHPPSMSPLVQNGHQSPMQHSPAMVPSQGQQSPMRHPASPAIKDNQMSPMMQHPQMVGMPQSGNFQLGQMDNVKLGQAAAMIDPGKQTPTGVHVGIVNQPSHAVGVENPFSDEFEQRERMEKFRMLQEHQKPSKEAIIHKLQQQSMAMRGHPLPPEIVSQLESQMQQHQAHHMNMQQLIQPEQQQQHQHQQQHQQQHQHQQQQQRRSDMQAPPAGMQFLNQVEPTQPPMPVGGTAHAEKAPAVPPSYPQNKPAKKPKKKKSKKDKEKQQQQQLSKSQDFTIPPNSILPDMSAFDQHLNAPSAAVDLNSLQGQAIAEALEKGDLRAKTTQNLLLKQLLRGPQICAANSVPAGVVQMSGENVMSNIPTSQPGMPHALPHHPNAESHLPPQRPLAGLPMLPAPPGTLARTADSSGLQDDDANIKLTPEQQKQLEMVEKLPYVKKNGKPAENDHQILIEIHRKGKYSSNSKKNKEKDTDSHKKKHKDKKKKKRKKGEEKKPASLDDLMAALKSLPILQLSEPAIESNISICPLFGTPANGGHRLRGSYGNAILEGVADFYGALVNGPLGKKELANGPSALTEDEKKKISKKGVQALTVKSSEVTVMTGDEIMQEMQSHQRTITRTINHAYTGRGNHSSPLFALSAASSEAGNILSQRSGTRTLGSTTPGEIAPSSSPELEEDEPLETARMRGLRLITRNATEMAMMARADSPNIPIIKPTPRKGKSAIGLGNTVNVCLTVGSAMNSNIKELLGSISKLLRVIEPKTYEVIQGNGDKECFGVKETTTEVPKPVPSIVDVPPVEVTPPTAMEVDHKPGTPPKPQDVAGARFCKHCDVMIVGEGIHKVTGPSADSSHTFCSTTCYMQYTISQRTQLQQSKDTVTKILDTQNSDGDNMTPPPNVNVPLSGSLPTSPLPSALSPRTSRASPAIPTVASPSVSTSPPVTTSPEVTISVPQPSVKVILPRVDLKEQQQLLKEPAKEDTKTKASLRRKTAPGDENAPQSKKIKMKRWRKWSIMISPTKRRLPPKEEDIDELMRKLGTSLQPGNTLEDKRACILCSGVGDGDTDGTARLLNVDVGVWIHLNCALWSDNVYETLNGALMNVMNCIKQGKSCKCCYCCKAGATVSCHKQRCYNVYHFGCAIQDHCMFFKDKTMLCPLHAPSKATENTLDTHVVFRRVYVSRDEHRQVASIMQQAERTHTLRVGSLIFHSLGQLLPHQMQTFHSSTAIFPVGYETVRLYWSMRFTNKRCQYYCSIQQDDTGIPCFIIKVVEQGHEDLLLQDKTPKAVWDQVLEHIAKLRQEADMINLFPYYLTGEDLFGFSEPAIQRVLESLPGIEMIQNYSFRYGRSPHINLPLAVNPTGCARTEPKRQARFRPHLLLTSTIPSRSKSCLSEGDYGPLYNKLFVHTKSSQYKKLKTDWKQCVYLAKSNIQGLGMYAATEIEKHTMVIEYVGTLIRNETSNLREKNYNAANRGIYMFRIDNDTVCDATISGNAARYINHSCDPNCVAEVVTFGPDTKKIIIFSNRKLVKGEELTYDYKFDIEDDRQKKIPCTCKAHNCRKWMN